MNILKRITKILYECGDVNNDYIIALADVWINYGHTNLNIYIKNKRTYIKCTIGYEYPIASLSSLEQYSILTELLEYENQCKQMLNEKDNFELNY